MAETPTEGTGNASIQFESISPMDSKSLMRPNVLLLAVSNHPKTGPNIMTAGWWTIAGYDPLRYLLTVEEKTFTYELVERNPEFVLSVPTMDMVDAVALAGSVSGRDVDKIDHLDLDTVPGTEVDVPLLADALGNVECDVVKSFSFDGRTYYFGEAVAAHAKPGVRDGRLLDPQSRILANMGSDWKHEDDVHKHRYYLEFDRDDVSSYPTAEVIETLPPVVLDALLQE